MISGIERLGLPDVQLADSAYGVRDSAPRGRYATVLPSVMAEAATFDPKMAFAFGEVIGRELRDQKYNTSIGGGMDLTREPRNGRNFEYQGEDPILAGKMAAQLVKGVQSNKVIGDLKHYAFNDQETGRSIVNAKLDKRTARETDLLAFEIAVTEGQPGMIMCSYNKFNGDWACENSYLLTDVLKKAWGFKGFVLSDWGGTHSTAKAVLAGLDNEESDARFLGDPLKQAVEKGEVPMARLNDLVHRILRTEFAYGIVDDPPRGRVVDPFRGADTAQSIAEAGFGSAEERQQPASLERRGGEVHRVDWIACRHRRAHRRRLGAGGSDRRRPRPVRRRRGVGPLFAAQGHPRQGRPKPRWSTTTGPIPRRRRPWPRLRKWPSCSSTSPPARGATWPA